VIVPGTVDTVHGVLACFARTIDDPERIHGKDEWIGVENYGDSVRLYGQLIGNSASR
jgi:acetylornithine deacetylase/succinyl-diaminopimelate desuccinylase-like protein